MKQIQAVVQSDKLSSVIDAMEKVGVGGITVSQTRGRGKGQRPAIESGRGTGVHIAEFSSFDTLFAVVEDTKIEDLITAIKEAASTGSKGDGKIFISPVEETVDIGSKQRGEQSL